MNKEDLIISLLKEIDENIANVNDNEGTNANLEELTITSNGTYTPQEGVDGFSKVVAEFDTSSLPKVKVAGTLIVNQKCINDDGIWEGEQLIDTSQVSSLRMAFDTNTALKRIDMSEWDISNVGDLGYCFQACRNLELINASPTENKNKQLYHTFLRCTSLVELVGENRFVTSTTTNVTRAFMGCTSLTNIDTTLWDCSNISDAANAFSDCFSLKSIIGNNTIDDVLANNIGALNGLKIGLILDQTVLDRASLRALINGLADLTGSDTQTLTLGATLIAKLTEEDIAIATAKNWTLS